MFFQFLLDDGPTPSTRNSIELLSVSHGRLATLMERVDGINMMTIKMEMEEEEFVPTGLDVGGGIDINALDEDKGAINYLKLCLLTACTVEHEQLTEGGR
jgi:hypothetical protein